MRYYEVQAFAPTTYPLVRRAFVDDLDDACKLACILAREEARRTHKMVEWWVRDGRGWLVAYGQTTDGEAVPSDQVDLAGIVRSD